MRTMLGVLAAILIAWVPDAAAQQTPEQVVSAYFRHLQRGEMGQAARLTHPDALNAFRDLVARARAAGESYGYSDDAFPARTDVSRLPADSVLAVMLAAFQEREGFLKTFQVEPLGHVMHGDSALVVTQASISAEGESIEYPLVFVLRRDGAQWKIDPGRAFADVVGGGVLYLLGIHELRDDIEN